MSMRRAASCCQPLQLIQATALLIVIIYVVANLVADILYAVLNPRIRYQ